jgi:hypothetical protein
MLHLDKHVEDRYLRWLAMRLLKRLLRIRVLPVFVIDFHRKIHVNTVVTQSRKG